MYSVNECKNEYQGKYIDFILELLRDHIGKKKSSNRIEEFKTLDYKCLIDIACKQQIQGIIAFQIKDIVDGELMQESNRIYLSSIMASMKRENLVNSLKQCFEKNMIEYCVVKGGKIAEYYPFPQLRSMGDVDIIIHKNDRKKTDAMLKDAGFEHIQGETDEWVYRKNGICIEVHDSMVHPHPGNKYLVDYFNGLWKHGINVGCEFVLNWSFHFVYILQHLSGHFMITGIGIRQFIDLYIIANSVELDWKWIKEQLEQIRLWKFCLMCMGFCKTTFGPLKENIPYKEVDESTYRDTIKKIFRDGVFGQYDEHNKKYAKAMMAKIYEKKDKKYVIRNIKKLFFPSYLEIGKYPRCQFVKKQRVLLPIGWLVRYYQIICSVIKKEKTISIVQSVNKNDSEFVKRIDYMQRWGL